MADLTYKMTVTLTDGTEIDAGNFTAPQGPAGADGAPGPRGPAGPEGLIYGEFVTHQNATTVGQAFPITGNGFARVPSEGERFIYLLKTADKKNGIGVATILSASVTSARVLLILPLNGISNVNVHQV